MGFHVDGVLVGQSGQPVIQMVDHTTGKTTCCDYGSSFALKHGLDNPKHWAHAVYRTLDHLCSQHRDSLLGATQDEGDHRLSEITSVSFDVP